ncbi:hypothetical protein LB507_009855 [Fusarium sp. FIESC RH6]|nr:hypothetical protein LB507_009855 [Fusarium sp. FIESC RH6]
MPLPPPFSPETSEPSWKSPFDMETSEPKWKPSFEITSLPPPSDPEPSASELLAAPKPPSPRPPINIADLLPKRPPPRDVQFRFGSRTIKAVGAPPEYDHKNVLRLKIRRNIWDRLVQSLFSIVSRFTGSLLPGKFPEWFLPDRIVLKSEKDDWQEEFDNEIVAYNRLRPLQGDTIPRFYGCTSYNNRRAIVISDVGGFCLIDSEGAVLSKEDLEPLFYQSLRSLNAYGAGHDDTKLDNMILVTDNGRDKIVVIDLESAYFEYTEEDLLSAAGSDTNHRMWQYEKHLEYLKHHGILFPRRPVRI